MKPALLPCLFLLIAITANAQKVSNNFKVNSTFKIGGSGGWDYLAVQPNSNRLFVSHGTQVNIINKNTGDSIGIIKGTTGVHGIAFVPSLNKGFTSNGRLNNVYVFDLKTFAIKDSIATGQNPDAIFYDDFSGKLITCNGRSNDLTFIDPATQKAVATVPVGGRPETAVSNGAGKIFVNIEDKNEIAVVDAKTFTVITRWPLLGGEAPTGLAIDTKNKRLFAACGDNKMLVIMDAEKGNIVTTLPIGDGCDGDAFDPLLHNIYTSNGGDGTLTIIHEDSKDKFTVTTTLATKKGARTMALDEQSHTIYMPTAEFEPSTGKGRPKMIAGTFQVVAVSNK